MASSPRSRAGRGGSPRSAARLAAVQALYQVEMTDAAGSSVAAEFVKHRIGQEIDGDDYVAADPKLFGDLVTGTLARMEELDPIITDALTPEWPLDRLEVILRAILRAATFELVARIDTPARVVITEYVDVAHAFFAGKEPGLANGVLDRIARTLRPSEWE